MAHHRTNLWDYRASYLADYKKEFRIRKSSFEIGRLFTRSVNLIEYILWHPSLVLFRRIQLSHDYVSLKNPAI